MAALLILTFAFGFVFGVVATVAAEAYGAFVILNKLSKRSQKDLAKVNAKLAQSKPDLHQSLDYLSHKQGSVWILESSVVEDFKEKATKEQKKRKDFWEVTPSKKYARIKDHSLTILEPDGKEKTIRLKGCTIEAVSASALPSRKWVKRFPLKLENRTSVIYNESKTIFIFLETSWEKEAWCKALRLASCVDKERLRGFAKLQKEFHSYISSLNTGYPSFMKPSAGYYVEAIDKDIKPNASSSKVRLFFKKLTKKTSKAGIDYKVNSSSCSSCSSSSLREEKKFSERFHPSPDFISSSAGLGKGIPKVASAKSLSEEVMASPSTLTNSGSQGQASVVSDPDPDDRLWTDDGTLCWNLFMSRFFFDATSNERVMKSLHDRVQRLLSKMRTPSYIGEVICTKVRPGSLPPNINAIRVLPFELNEVWALEVDFEYSGGFCLDIETRIEVHELDLQKNAVDSKPDSSDVGEVSLILEDYLGKQFSTSEGTEQHEEGRSVNGKNPTASSSSGSRWKSLMNSIAKQVSQVPISVVVKIVALRGTLRLHIKPPPSDQLWYGFTSMPNLELRLESSFGDHKITSTHVSQFLINRLKAMIRDTLVLPNYESIYFPFMTAEKDDWVPRDAAPFMWLNHENQRSHPVEPKNRAEANKTTATDQHGTEQRKPKNIESSQPHSDLPQASKTSSSKALYRNETKIPLLEYDEKERDREYVQENESPSRSVSFSGQERKEGEEDEPKPRRIGRRARMREIGKKMGEKIEEKSKNIVEKMRGP
ncbi:uncharacterized protein LOC111802383 [Cucurbita pepo subsp. pepo]|uniref:uncharacterized protein LOC111802383 n=1 Tax=Cucurbita pepo subsp. pepo TaxID=3664 RepID=UPI000C9D2B24|nr:uncharacterized protein LOC111802383 [Cucurbita pepo subsp. pepo]